MKHKTKKIFLSLGSAAMVVAPVASAVSCGTNNHVDHYKLLPTYTGQADQLIALGIKADYYPYQLEKHSPFDYLTDAKKYISVNQPDKTFAERFAAKVRSLIPDARGDSWWNQQALADDERGSNPEYWTHKGGDLVLYEHYLLDDGAKTINNSTAPKHTDSPSTFIQTNFRQSRDPFTRMSEGIIRGLMDQDVYDGKKNIDGTDTAGGTKITADEKTFIGQMLDAARQAELTGTEKAVDGEPQPTGKLKDNFEFEDGQPGSWLYNDYNFAKNYHIKFLDDETFKTSEFKNLVLDAKKNWIFDKDPAKNAAIAKLFYASTFKSEAGNNEEEILSKIMNAENPQLDATQTTLKHHPIYDQQTEIAAAPMFEGALRDNSLYLYDLASKLTNATTNKLGDDAGYTKLQAAFNNNTQWTGMQNALANANKIEKDLQDRQVAIRDLVDAITVDNNNTAPVFGVATLAPSKNGVSTIQSSSKYSFLYRELGFAQPLPTDFTGITEANGGNDTENGEEKKGDTLFNMDDNGWWWNISKQNGDGSTDGVDSDRTKLFTPFKYGVLTVDGGKNGNDYSDLKDNDKEALNALFVDKKHADHIVDYNLWNEGLKTPFVMHMLLDHVVDLILKDAQKALKAVLNDDAKVQAKIDAAYNWGKYFTEDYLA